ncbi:uncharacterized protein LOC133198128 [Saccostrea echinata]|uniref:uncharacterized protein LOC133198128 n=1 Tax=Saccostrea echinata TaxID=191078 RepID=UPI002A82A387|nr:uncharacterized protein LOC133198128 [Saccostrea echinata]
MASQETVSEASVCSNSKLEALNNFLMFSGASPVKEHKEQITSASYRTQQRYIAKAKECIEHLFSTICPGDEGFLRSAVFGVNSVQEDITRSTTLDTLVDIYNSAESWTLQRQILSIIIQQHSFDSIQKLIPDVTRYKYDKAREHSEAFGVGEPVRPFKQSREKFDADQLDHFIDFITNGHVIKDQPLGEKTLKLTTGEIIKIPSVIRSLTPTSVIQQYIALCKEENVKPLGTSTMYKLLDDCSAMLRRSVEGLDNFVMDGCRAFQELESTLDCSQLPQSALIHLREGLRHAKRYLKSEFKMHVEKESSVPDHCISYALSITGDECFGEVCLHDEHNHNSICIDCEKMDNTLNQMKTFAESQTWRNEDATMYMVEEAIIAIRKWKAHILRSKNQERARKFITDQMTDEDVLVTCDWAMKFLPKKYREGQIDWFAKRGINWHISVSLLKKASSFSTVTHVHLFESPTQQDASVTTNILIDVAKDLMKCKPTLKNIHFVSDNAGCYKSSSTLVMLHKELPENVKSYNFSEAQNGKGPCDRRAAHIKGVIRRYINEGHDVTTATQMKLAIDREEKEELKVKVVSTVNLVDLKPNKVSIPAISTLYNFCYNSEGLNVWKAFSVGKGKMLPWSALGLPTKSTELKTILDWKEDGICERNLIIENSMEETKEESAKRIFQCPKENCYKSFSTPQAVDSHILLGDCSGVYIKRNLYDSAKVLYAGKLQNLFPSKEVSMPAETNPEENANLKLKEGWAMKESKKKSLFNERQKEFIKEKFAIGKVTGNKVDPFLAAKEMREMGSFTREEFLTGQQIASYFCRLHAADRNISSEDYASAKAEQEDEDMRSSVKKILFKE